MISFDLDNFFFDLPCSAAFEFETSYTSLTEIYVCVLKMEHVRFLSS